MKKFTKNSPRKNTGRYIIGFILLILLISTPLAFLHYQSIRSGMSWSEIIQRKWIRSANEGLDSKMQAQQQPEDIINFLIPEPVGQSFTNYPQISHLQVIDFDNDGLPDIIVCDAMGNFISLIRQYPSGKYTESVLAEGLIAPAHVQVIDFDKDGDNDLLVAVLGMLFPNNDKIGSVVILENLGSGKFDKHIVADKIARVSDVRSGDLDNDGDLDLAVAQFGYDDGETRWIENLGNWEFSHHILQYLSGTINVEIVDIDFDNDLDIISLVSQEWEEVYCFLNNGDGKFETILLYGSSNEDFGSSGIFLSDLDKDGDSDILLTNGDAFDYIPPRPRPWHGVNWLENKGNLTFVFHRISNFAGAYNARPADIDKDGDLDIFVVSGFNLWENRDAQSFIWLENIGNMTYRLHKIANSPTHLITLESGDFNNDGLIDFATGGMHTYPPYDRLGRITIWMNNGTVPNR